MTIVNWSYSIDNPLTIKQHANCQTKEYTYTHLHKYTHTGNKSKIDYNPYICISLHSTYFLSSARSSHSSLFLPYFVVFLLTVCFFITYLSLFTNNFSFNMSICFVCLFCVLVKFCSLCCVKRSTHLFVRFIKINTNNQNKKHEN